MLIDPIWFESGQLAAIEAFAKTLRPQDRIAIASLDKFKMLMNWRTVQSFRLQDVSTPSIGKPEFTPTTNLYDGLEEASRKFQNERGRKAIVVITHGRDREIMQQTLQLGSPLEIEDDKDFAKHLQALQRAKIPIHVIAKTQVELEEGKLHGPWFWYSETVMAAFLKGAQSRMETLAEQTGGRIIFPKSIAWSATTAQLRFEFEPIFRNVGLELGISYTLSYTPRNNQSDGTRRVIEVRATGGRVTQSRTEYTAR
jgi:hypothetical protein